MARIKHLTPLGPVFTWDIEPPKIVRNGFSVRFPEVTDHFIFDWKIVGDDFQADFDLKGKQATAIFDNQGKLKDFKSKNYESK